MAAPRLDRLQSQQRELADDRIARHQRLGGFATQLGNNFAVAFHERFGGGNELYVNYGVPAANTTLNRLIVKYVFHAGADAGT